MLTTTEGIILKCINYKDHDKLLTILTRDLGVVFARAPRARRMSSPLRPVSNPFAYAEFVLFRSKERYIIDSADSIRLFYGLAGDIVRTALASYICELTAYVAPELSPAPEHFPLVLNALHLTEQDARPPALIKAAFELRVLSASGFMPSLVACVDCACFEAETMFFRPADGTIRCTACRSRQIPADEILYPGHPAAGDLALSPGVLHAMRHIIYSDDGKVFHFSLGEENLSALRNASEQFTLHRIDHRLATLEFLKTLI